ncbi:MAG TPA: hypothetical protein PK698_06530 [Bacilli bacterium]|nr:hypothetical protein [Bacilli bacterium]
MSIKQNIEKRKLEVLYTSFLDIKAKLESAKLKLIEANENLTDDPRTQTEVAKRTAVVAGFKYQIGKIIENIELNTQYLTEASQEEITEIDNIKLELVNN